MEVFSKPKGWKHSRKEPSRTDRTWLREPPSFSEGPYTFFEKDKQDDMKINQTYNEITPKLLDTVLLNLVFKTFSEVNTV